MGGAMIKQLVSLFLLATASAWAGLPPTSFQGQSDANSKTKFFFQTPFSQSTDLGGVKSLIETGNKNILPNPGFEAVSLGWTNTGANAPTIDSGSPATGKQDLAWTPAAATNTATSASITIPAGLQGQNGLLQCSYKSAGVLHALTVYNGTNTIATTGAIAGTGSYQYVSLNFVFPASGTIQAQIIAGDTTALNLDDCYLGAAINISNVSQIKELGSLTYLSTASCQWNATSVATFTNFSNVAACPTPSVTGSASAPGTKIPGITFASAPAGTYYFYVESEEFVLQFSMCTRMSDGTNASTSQCIDAQNTSTTATVSASTKVYRIVEATSQSNVTFQLQYHTNSNISGITAPFIRANTTADFHIHVLYIPPATSQAVNVSTSGGYWSGSMAGTGWTNTSNGSFADFAAGSGISLTQRQAANFATVTAAAGSLPGITFTPNINGGYLVCAHSSMAFNTGASTVTGTVRLIDSNSTVLNNNASAASTGTSNAIPFSECGLETISNAGTAITIKLQGEVNAASTMTLGPFTVGSAIEWLIIPITSSMPAPVFTGVVSSSTTGTERVERAAVGASGGSQGAPTLCTSNPCAIYAQSGSWLSSVTWNSTGSYTLNIASGEFSSAPTCVVSVVGGTLGVDFSGATNLSVSFTTFTTSTLAVANAAFNVVCMGPH